MGDKTVTTPRLCAAENCPNQALPGMAFCRACAGQPRKIDPAKEKLVGTDPRTGGSAVEPSRCRSCGAAIWWLKHKTSGKLAPIVAHTVPLLKGNIKVDLAEGTYEVVGPGKGYYINHFTDCVNAKQHAKK